MADDLGDREADPRKVFVIHGRNEVARKALFDFLRAIGLDPIEWSQAVAMTGKGSPYIGEVLDTAFAAAQAVVVLQTPDDVAYLHESLSYPGDPECTPQMQPRPNVLFEAGMAMGRDENRTIMVELGRVKVFSDAHGRHAVRLDNSVGKRQELATRLTTAGCAVNTTGTDWHDAGDFTPPAPPGGGLPLGRKLPSAEASGLPRLEARLVAHEGNKTDELFAVNHGPGDVYELNAEIQEGAEIQGWPEEGLPIPRLPAGKSVRIMRTHSFRGASYFTVILSGKTADGTELRQEEFVSG